MKIFQCSVMLLILTLFVHQNSVGQTANNPIPASPTAMTFQKYVDYPVDYSTGVPQISIPLYTINLKDYSFPVSASFHASGRTTAMNFSVLGMNWALNATGVINREVRGRPDESATSGHVENATSSYSPQGQHYYDLMSIDPNTHIYSGYISAKDNQYDIYSIYVNGISAKFIIKDNGAIVFLTYCPYTLTGGWGGFILTDDKGVVYKFGVEGASGTTETPYDSPDPYLNKPTSWYLSSINTPSGSHIYFKYKRSSKSFSGSGWIGNWTYKDVAQFQDCENWNALACNDAGGCYTRGTFDNYCSKSNRYKITSPEGRSNYDQIYVDNIVFDNGKIAFNVNDNVNTCLLTSCTVSTNDGAMIKNIVLSYYSTLPKSTDVLPNNNSTTIHYITFKDNKNKDIEQYGFDYYDAPSFYNLADFAKSKDFWGYCNSLSQSAPVSTKFIPLSSVHVDFLEYDPQYNTTYNNEYLYNINGNVNCKNPSFLAKQAGMIKTIYYPTGGKSDYLYEPNKIKDAKSNIIEGPGLRIKQITSDDGYGHITGKTYEYGDDGTGSTLVVPSKDYDYFTEKRKAFFINGGHNIIAGAVQGFQRDFLGSCKTREYSSDAVSEVEAASHFPTYYQKVTEYDYSASGVKNGRMTYTYTYPATYHTYTFAPDPGSGGPVSTAFGSNDYFAPQVYSYNEWETPQLDGKLVEKWDAASNSYKPITSTRFTSVTLNRVDIPQVSIYKYWEFPTDDGSAGFDPGTLQKKMMEDYNWIVYVLLDKPISCAVKKPQSETTITYDDAGNKLTTSTNYFYDNLVHVNPTRITTATSDGKIVTKYITYPGDYATSPTSTLSLPMEQVTVQTSSGVSKVIAGKINTYSNNVVSQSYRWESASPVDIANFKFSNGAMGVLPPSGSQTAFNPDGKYTSKIVFAYDNKNNPITVTPDKNMAIAYIWGYNQTYPIAEIKNALPKNVFYTSFEEGDGNSTAGDRKTGQYSYTGSFSKTLSNLNNGKYILSYWMKTAGVWILNSSIVNVTAGTYSISLNAQIDELRFYPENAFMKTYTYQPLIGMTSQDDEKDIITSYEYDDYGRLQLIRDKDNNIVKKICYSLQGRASTCEVVSN